MTQIKISILGDICPRWYYHQSFDKHDISLLFGDVLNQLQESDLVLANLECPATNRNTPIIKCGPNLKAKPEDLEVLKNAGINAIALANNHILDFGHEAIMDTLKIAASINISTYGAGKDNKDAEKVCYRKIQGKCIGLMAFAEEEFNCATLSSSGANLFDPYISLNQIEDAKKNCDYLIVQYHGGIEHYRFPSPLLQKKCRGMSNAGADLILCQHSHCIGTYENYNNSMILYGQGNAIFGRKEGNEAWNTGLLVTVNLTDDNQKVNFKVFEAGDKGIAFVSEIKNSNRLLQMDKESDKLCDSSFIMNKWIEFCHKQESVYLPDILCWGRISNKLNRLTDNLLGRLFLKQKKLRVAMNLIRCDAHREVLQTILENNVFTK